MRNGGAVAYCLPPDVSGRHLLLCFGWLLSHGIVETVIDKLILDSPLGEELYINVSDQGPVYLNCDFRVGIDSSSLSLNLTRLFVLI